jgi:hypothetical protein
MIEGTIPFDSFTISSAQLEALHKKVREDYYGYRGVVRVKLTTGLFVPTVISAYPACENYPRPKRCKSRMRMSKRWRKV